jgi:hypothetical protein
MISELLVIVNVVFPDSAKIFFRQHAFACNCHHHSCILKSSNDSNIFISLLNVDERIILIFNPALPPTIFSIFPEFLVEFEFKDGNVAAGAADKL